MGLLGPYLHPFDPGAGLREFISMPTAGLGNLMDDVEHYGGGGKRSMNDAGLDEVCSFKFFWFNGYYNNVYFNLIQREIGKDINHKIFVHP